MTKTAIDGICKLIRLLMNERTRSLILLHLVVFAWGFSAVLGDLISLGIYELVWYRMAICVVVLVGYMYYTDKNKFKIEGSKNLANFIVGGLVLALHWVCFYQTIKISKVSIALVTISATAFFTAFLSPLWNKKKVILHEIMLGIVVIFGIAVAFWESSEHIGAVFLGIVASLFAAIFSIINADLVKSNPPSRIAFYELISGSIFLGLWMLFFGKWESNPLYISILDWIYLFLLAFFCTAFAFVNSIKVMRHLSAYTSVLIVNLEPLYGVVLAFFILGEEEEMSVRFYIGMLITLLAVFSEAIIMKHKNRKKIVMQ